MNPAAAIKHFFEMFHFLCPQRALHVRAVRAFKDAGGRSRRTGEEWLVTMGDREAHIPSVAEEVVGVVDVTTLSSRQYCVILDPVGPDGKPQLGQKRVVKVRKVCPLTSVASHCF